MSLAAHISEQASAVNYARNVTHGMSTDPKFKAEYQAWRAMKRRCYNKNCPDYPKYGGAGIFVCDRWKNDFAAFFSDMGHRPSSAHSMDRKDGLLGYSKENCRWATKEEQSRDRPEFVIPLSYNGVTKTLAEWANEMGIHPQTLYNRHNSGWSVERMLGQKPSHETRSDNRFIAFGGETLTVAQWTKKLGLKRNTLKQRLRMGWDIERALSRGLRP